MRPICPACNENPVSINYIREDVTHYRSRCAACIRKGKKLKRQTPNWYRAGYRKKPACDLCGFIAKIPDKQINVWHMDGNLNNVDRVNLKSICLNCTPEVYSKRNIAWKPSPPIADF